MKSTTLIPCLDGKTIASLPFINSLIMFLFQLLQQSHVVLAAPSHTGCLEKVADVVFLLDSSHSIHPHQFRQQLDFVQGVVDTFTISPHHIRVGVVTFSHEVRLDAALNQYTDKLSLRRAIRQIEYIEQAGTRTGYAIRYAYSEMFSVSLVLITTKMNRSVNKFIAWVLGLGVLGYHKGALEHMADS